MDVTLISIIAFNRTKSRTIRTGAEKKDLFRGLGSVNGKVPVRRFCRIKVDGIDKMEQKVKHTHSLAVIFIATYSQSVFAHGNIQQVFYSIAIFYQLFLLLLLYIWIEENKKKILFIFIINVFILWAIPWKERELVSYYSLLFKEPMFFFLVLFVYGKFYKKIKNKK